MKRNVGNHEIFEMFCLPFIYMECIYYRGLEKVKNNRVLTLYYHRVNISEIDYNLLCVSPIKFRQQMLYLKHNYQIVRFEDDWNTLDSDAVAITFDDGYLDNLKYALPILEEVEVPATIFISTGTMNQTKELWWDELEQLLIIGDDFPPLFQLKDEEFQCQWNTSTYEYRKNCYLGIHYLMKNFISSDKREDWLMQLWKWRGLIRTVRESNLTVSVEDCRKLAKSKMISIGAHTISHSSLANLDRKNQEMEIKTSIDSLSQILKQKITLFSYPFGVPKVDFNEDTVEICCNNGIIKAASTENALWNSSVSPYYIPRKIVRDWNLGEFDRKIKDYWNE